MDFRIQDGDIAVDRRGRPAQIVGQELSLQRIYTALCAKKGGFPLDPTLGSRLYALRHGTEEQMGEEALAIAREALSAFPEVTVRAVTVTDHRDREAVSLSFLLDAGGVGRTVTVEV